MALSFQKLKIPEVILITPQVYNDERGFFLESYKKSEFEQNGITQHLVQSNHSGSSKGVLRGLHYQKEPHAQAKLIRCIRGEIFDVAVDIRQNSPTFGQWIGLNLSEINKQMLYIPEGFAHGFYTISSQAEIIYHITKEYNPRSDSGIIWNDPDIAIEWPEKNVILSAKDEQLLRLKNIHEN